jgi:hypothetical protein
MVQGLAALALLFGGTGRAEAGLMTGEADPVTFNFDERGNGSISINGGPIQALNGTLLPDPSNGGKPALTFLLPGAAGPAGNGDVRIFEDVGQTILGDVLRFTDAAGNLSGATADRMIFYSALGGGLLADTGFPANLGAGQLANPVIERADGTFQYRADATNVYTVVSEVVPEPSTLALLTLGGIALAGWQRWKGKRPQVNPAA